MRQCTDWLSATQNGLGAAEGISTHQELNPSLLIHCYSLKPLSHRFVSISRKKQYMTCCISPPATNFFCVQDCCGWIFQVEYQGRTQNTRILKCNPLINTSFCIQHKLKLKFFHLAQFLLNAH